MYHNELHTVECDFSRFDGDISILPSWADMSPLYLPPYEQLIISGEDIRIFILHIFGAPSSWYPLFLCFNRLCQSRYAVQRLDGDSPAVQSELRQDRSTTAPNNPDSKRVFGHF